MENYYKICAKRCRRRNFYSRRDGGAAVCVCKEGAITQKNSRTKVSPAKFSIILGNALMADENFADYAYTKKAKRNVWLKFLAPRDGLDTPT